MQTPAAALGPQDLGRIDEALAPFVTIFALTPQCQGEAAGIGFSGRFRDGRDGSVAVWLGDGRITRLDR